MEADACVFSVVKKMYERFAQKTKKQAKVMEEGLKVTAAGQSQNEV